MVKTPLSSQTVGKNFKYYTTMYTYNQMQIYMNNTTFNEKGAGYTPRELRFPHIVALLHSLTSFSRTSTLLHLTIVHIVCAASAS